MNSGKSRIACFGITLPRFVPCVSSSGAAAVTSTVCSNVPIANVMFASVTVATWTTTPETSAFRNPVPSALTVYVPEGRYRIV